MDRGSTSDSAPDAAARRAGWLLLATAVTTVVAEYGRVAAGADLPTLAESLAAIALRRGWYGIGGMARMVSGILLCAGAWYLWHTRFMRRGVGTLLVSVLLSVSGLVTAISGILAVALAQMASSQAVEAAVRGGSAELVAELRWISGKIGFTLAGLAFLATAVRQWQVGGTWRRLALLSGTIGVAMQLIWMEGASGLHRVTGPLFLVWLVLIGFLLVSGRVERRFAGRVARGSRRS